MQRTIKNLTKAFIGESQARNRYTMYAKIAIKEGYQKVAGNFSLTADQEAEHAKWLMRMINNLKDGHAEFDKITVEADAPTILGNTVENLKSAIEGEKYEHSSMYPEFADIADEENLPEVSKRLRSIAKAEENHEDNYKKMLEEIETGTMFKKSYEVTWVCRKCGHIHTGLEALEECPSCGHPQGYFEVKI